jgi:hypothetical protein
MLGGGPAYVAVTPWLAAGASGSYLEGDADAVMLGYGGPSVGFTIPVTPWLCGWLALTVGPGGADLPAGAPGGPAGTGLLVVEPEAALFVGIGQTSRIGIGGSWRLAVPFAPQPGLTWDSLSGFSAQLALQYGIFQPTPGAPTGTGTRPRLTMAGCVSQKFSLVRGQLARFDGGSTRVVIDRHWAVGARGSRAADGIRVDGNAFRMMEAGAWAEYIVGPERVLSASVGTLAGVAMVGYISGSTGEMVGGPAILLNPEAAVRLAITPFARLSLSAGFRLAVPFAPVPGLGFWDTSGPTASVDLAFGVF